MQQTEIEALVGMKACSHDGETIGRIDNVYLDERTELPAWVSLKTGVLGLTTAWAPLSGAHVSGDRLVLPWSKDKVVHSPRLGDGWPPSDDDAQSLYQYYATAWMDGQVGSGATARGAGAAYSPDDPAEGIADAEQVSHRTGAGSGSDALPPASGPTGPQEPDPRSPEVDTGVIHLGRD